VNDTLIVLDDGRFTVSRRGGAVRSGTLTPAQVGRLAALVSDPAFAAEARRGQPPSQCAVAFHYTFTAGGVVAAMDDCGKNAMPLFAAVVGYLSSATGF